jgi:two-component system chemotaxis sensor kinase CheA
MGDGQVALILDVLGIAQLSGVVQESREQARSESGQTERAGSDRQAFLLFRAGSFDRLSVPLSLVARLEEIPQSKIERAGGKSVVQYRGKILQLAALGSILEPGSEDPALRQDPAQVVVFNSGDRSIGVMVDQILDIAEETVSVRQSTERKGLLGSAVIGKKVTDVLDLHAVIDSVDAGWFGGRESPSAGGATVMVAEPSAFSRWLIRSSLEMEGYRVVEAADTQSALCELEHGGVDVVLAALDLPSSGAYDFLEKMRLLPAMAGIPAVALANSADEAGHRGKHSQDFEDCQVRFDRVAMLRSIARLAAAVGAADANLAPAGEKELSK